MFSLLETLLCISTTKNYTYIHEGIYLIMHKSSQGMQTYLNFNINTKQPSLKMEKLL
jgi:hypothetical protein